MVEPEEVLAAPAPSRKKALICECAVIVCLGFLPSMLSSIPDVLGHTRIDSALTSYVRLRAAPMTIRHLGIIAAILFTLLVAGELRILGLKFVAKIDVPIIAALVAIWVCQSLFRGELKDASPPIGDIPTGELCVAVLGIGISAAAQEILFRGYMLPRFGEIFDSKWIGWGITTVLFGTWHLYQGPTGALSALVYGGIAGLVVLSTNRLIAVIALHTITNSWLFIVTVAAYQGRFY